ncbi:PA0069 family radical SAM protein [Luteolibacter sp. LG18]|uniref:PA0069 family radical SAM protein n=1 Tax=Luteolibacter sp. LG18 TaxID=2819286 RepID=UPI002B2D9FF0|nr:radical SAM protein [Luteolibacter sp. LG18]
MAERGRGADGNPLNRFDRFHVETDEDAWVDDDPRPLKTVFLGDDSQSILTKNDAEDLAFEYGLNPYRGCEHGCAYCYARTYHEYLGFSAGLDFESKIVVKRDAPALLEKALAKKTYQPGLLAISGATDCYQPVERKLGITRGCLEVCARFRQPVLMITKNTLVTRDLDHLTELARHQAAAVFLSVTSLDPKLARIMEPRAASPRARLETIHALAEAGVPAGVSAAPMIPGLNDSELPAILAAAKEHGASFAMYSMVRLPGSVAQVFGAWLERHFPDRKEKVLGRIRAAYEGELNSTAPGLRNRGAGAAAGQLRALFHASCRRIELATRPPELSLAAFRRVTPGQGELF